MDKKKPDADKKSAEKSPEMEEIEVRPNPEQPPDNGSEETEDFSLKGLGLPDRDLKKNLGCG
jgi:hypothetical protein